MRAATRAAADVHAAGRCPDCGHGLVATQGCFICRACGGGGCR